MEKPDIPFESTTSMLRKLTRDFLGVFLNCVMKDALINFLGGHFDQKCVKMQDFVLGKTLDK